jgi:hypothetical protein
VRQHCHLTERHACRLLFQWRGTQRYRPILRSGEDALTRAIVLLASRCGRYGYRRVTVRLRAGGWALGKDWDECLNGEKFYSLREAQVVIERWRIHCYTCRPHSSRGYRPPQPGQSTHHHPVQSRSSQPQPIPIYDLVQNIGPASSTPFLSSSRMEARA